MTHEEMERTMQFILEHQAKFSADLASINEALARHNEAIVDLVQISRALVDNQMAHQGQMSELRTEMRELAKVHKETDERLSAFITVVERYISGHNGGARQP